LGIENLLEHLWFDWFAEVNARDFGAKGWTELGDLDVLILWCGRVRHCAFSKEKQ
jgi:hypothetical protein